MNRRWRREKEQELRIYKRKLRKEQEIFKDFISDVKRVFYYILNNK